MWKQAHLNLKQALQSESPETLIATDTLTFKEVEFSKNETLTRALNRRKDYLQLQEDLKLRDVALQLASNARLPSVDLMGAVAYNGLDKNYDPALTDVTNGNFPTYYVGVRMSYPLGNHAARSEHEKSRLEKLAALYSLQKLQNDIQTEISEKIKILSKKSIFTTNLVIIPRRVVIHQLIPPVSAITIENRSAIQTLSEMFDVIWNSISETPIS